jgi:hypothetical protein
MNEHPSDFRLRLKVVALCGYSVHLSKWAVLPIAYHKSAGFDWMLSPKYCVSRSVFIYMESAVIQTGEGGIVFIAKNEKDLQINLAPIPLLTYEQIRIPS